MARQNQMRTSCSVAGTAAGDWLLDAIGRRLDEIQDAIEVIGELRDKPAGTVRVSASDAAGMLWLTLWRRTGQRAGRSICADDRFVIAMPHVTCSTGRWGG